MLSILHFPHQIKFLPKFSFRNVSTLYGKLFCLLSDNGCIIHMKPAVTVRNMLSEVVASVGGTQ